ncbi:MAG: hypothetical protein ACI94Y_003304 [Maribacter sp.]|jgi:hypothetical protein
MKNLIIAFLLFPLLLAGQDLYKQEFNIDKKTNLVSFTEIVQVNSTSSEELYSRAKMWFAKAYNSADDVIQVETKEKIYGKDLNKLSVSSSLGTPIDIKMNYTIGIYFKEGRYKYNITDITYQSYASKSVPNPRLNTAENLIVDKLYKKNGKPRGIRKRIQGKDNTYNGGSY